MKHNPLTEGCAAPSRAFPLALRSLVHLAVSIAPFIALAQSGPGGVGNSTSNFLWLDAGHGIVAPSGISQWQDRSGNNNHAEQSTPVRRPNLYTNSMNGYPSVEFDNDQTNYDFMVIPDNATLEGMVGLTGFVVYRLNNGTASAAPRCFFGKRDGVDVREAYAWFLHTSGSGISQKLDIDGTGNRAGGTTLVTTGVTHLNGFTYHGAAPSNNQDQVLYEGNNAVGNAIESSTSIPNYTSHIYIGTLQGHTGSGANASRFNGSMAEIILYNRFLNEAERILVNNYLAAKYDIALATADVYRQDNAANGNYDHDVAGIGRVNASNIHNDARGTGILRVNNPTGLGDNEFLVWGHDNGQVGTWGGAEHPATVEGRWQRTWRCSELNTSGTAVDVGAVDLTFDLNGLGTITTAHLRLLVDTDNDGLFADETPISGATALGGGLYRFSGVTALANGRRFTLGSTDIHVTPLPVELLRFSATPLPDHVELDWSTATEQHNERFLVERSLDLIAWGTVATVPGAGNSSSERHYTARDAAPVNGTSYYRLVQVDFDGTRTNSDVVVVERAAAEPLLLVPNPAHDAVTVHNVPPAGIRLLDALGRELPLPMKASPDGPLRIELGHLTPGIYFVATRDTDGAVRRLVVE